MSDREERLKLLVSEINKDSFVLNNISEKIYLIEKYIKENEFIPKKLLTILVNISLYESPVKFIIENTCILEQLFFGAKTFERESQLLHFVAHICITDNQYRLLLFKKYEILDIIAELNIFSTYKESIKWSLEKIYSDTLSTYHKTQLLYICLKMDVEFVHCYLYLMNKLCKKDVSVIHTFILEKGLYILHENFDRYNYSSVFLWLIFDSNKRYKPFISCLYRTFKDIIINKINFLPTFEMIEILYIVSKNIDIRDDIDINQLIDFMLDDNSFLIFYSSLRVLTNTDMTQEQTERLIDYIKKDDDEIDKYNYETYANFFLSIPNLCQYDCIELRKFADKLQEYKFKVHSKLDFTLKDISLTLCMKMDLELPHFINSDRIII